MGGYVFFSSLSPLPARCLRASNDEEGGRQWAAASKKVATMKEGRVREGGNGCLGVSLRPCLPFVCGRRGEKEGGDGDGEDGDGD